MKQLTVGKFISRKRKEKNYTQEQLAEKLGVSNKSVSKWENGKCMPDYAVLESLCKELDITIAELLDGKESTEKSVCLHDEQILDLLRRIQELEKQKKTVFASLLIIMGIALQALSYSIGGSDIKDFFSGLLLGISVAEMLLGIYVLAKSIAE